jgi:hypothetical protein
VSRTVVDFMSNFVVPLVAGGQLTVGRPIGHNELRTFEDNLGYATQPLVEVDEARTVVLSELVVRPPALVFDADELNLAAAIHNLLFFSHPRTDSWMITQSGQRKVLETAIAFAARPATTNRTRLLARHALLHNLFDVSRTDVKVSWWTGSAEYFGQRPPKRLARWKAVRRVREEQTVVSYDELLGTVEASPVVASLLRRSPLTHLLSLGRDGPPLHWEDAAHLLRDPELSRAVSYRAIQGAESAQSKVAAPAAFAAAFEQMLSRAPAEADLRVVAAFLVHLNVLLALGETRWRESKKSPILSAVLSPDKAGQRPRGLATFFALPNALAMVDPRLAEPPGLRQEIALAEEWDRHREQVRVAVGEAVIETLAGRLRLHLTPVLESPSRDGQHSGLSETAD